MYNVKIFPFDKSRHSHDLSTAMKYRRMESPADKISALPELGLVAYWDGEFTAAGFIRKVEGGYGMIDSYVTDPRIKDVVRNDVLNALTIQLLDLARANGITNLIMFSVDEKTIIRSYRHGFKKRPDTVATIVLEPKKLSE